MTKIDRLTGLIAAPHTPFAPDGSVALDQIDLQAEVLVAQGVSGVFVCGTTGEGGIAHDRRAQGRGGTLGAGR